MTLPTGQPSCLNSGLWPSGGDSKASSSNHPFVPEPFLGENKNAPTSQKSSKKEKHMPMFHLESVDPLPELPLLNIDVPPPGKKPHIDMHVVFVDKDGNALSKRQQQVIDFIVLPETAKMPTEKTGHAIIYGIRGVLLVVVVVEKPSKLSLGSMRELGGKITRILSKESLACADIHWDLFRKRSKKIQEQAYGALVHGLQTPTYRFDDLKQKKDDPSTFTRCVISDSGLSLEAARDIIGFVNNLVCAEQYCRRWIDMPAQPGCMSTMDAVCLADKISEQYPGLVIHKAIVGEELNRQGLNALWSVGKGRMPESPPALIVLKYMGAGEKKPIISFVGKCLVFDTGGEQIKPGDGMLGMKADMGGASAVLSAFKLLVERQAKVNVIATLAVADNTVSHNSYHPGDVLRTYGGKTIEVAHTDAEGRLAVADAIAYTEKNYKPDYLITLATLTGAAVVALGNEFAALYGKTERIVEALKTASAKTWNKAWHMPLAEAQYSKVKPSQIADVTNLGGRMGGSISAAKFLLEEFTETKHAGHLDIAPVAMDGYDCTGVQQKCSGGWGPALLWEAAHLLSKKGNSKKNKKKK